MYPRGPPEGWVRRFPVSACSWVWIYHPVRIQPVRGLWRQPDGALASGPPPMLCPKEHPSTMLSTHLRRCMCMVRGPSLSSGRCAYVTGTRVSPQDTCARVRFRCSGQNSYATVQTQVRKALAISMSWPSHTQEPLPQSAQRSSPALRSCVVVWDDKTRPGAGSEHQFRVNVSSPD
jgi:hypothetical protein